MTRSGSHRGLVVGGLVLVVALIIGLPLLAPLSVRLKSGKRTLCGANLHQIRLALEVYAQEHSGSFPDSLSQLSTNDVSPPLFLCPATDSSPGAMSDVDKWTSYKYTPGLNKSATPETPIVVCTHHKGGTLSVTIAGSQAWSSKTR
jgi:hypothetical protein